MPLAVPGGWVPRLQLSAVSPVRTATRTPHPYSVEKFLVFKGLQTGLRCKVLSAIELAAESSRVRTYGHFWGLFALFVSHCGIDVRHERACSHVPRLDLQLPVCAEGRK